MLFVFRTIIISITIIINGYFMSNQKTQIEIVLFLRLLGSNVCLIFGTFNSFIQTPYI